MSKKSKNLKKKGKKFFRDKEAKIQKIILTTFDLIAKKGYDKVSTNHIAAESNLSIGTVYRYFPEGKSAIVQAIALDMSSKFQLKELIPSIETSNLEDLARKVIYFYIKYHRENLVFIKALEKATLSSEIVRDRIDFFTQKIVHESLDLFHEFPLLAKIKIEELEKKLFIALKTIDTIIHHHLLISPFFDTDEKLLNYLIKLTLKIMEIEI